jgi:hypothetical protein
MKKFLLDLILVLGASVSSYRYIYDGCFNGKQKTDSSTGLIKCVGRGTECMKASY